MASLEPSTQASQPAQELPNGGDSRGTLGSSGAEQSNASSKAESLIPEAVESKATTTTEFARPVITSESPSPGLVEEASDEPSGVLGPGESSLTPMESSTATLKPTNVSTPSAPGSSSTNVLDSPTPNEGLLRPIPPLTLPALNTLSLGGVPLSPSAERSPTRSDVGFDERNMSSEDEREGVSRSEIQNIMDQYREGGAGPGHEEVMSPRLEMAGPLLTPTIQHPPRKSSLEPLNAGIASAFQSVEDMRATTPRGQPQLNKPLPTPARPPSLQSFGPKRSDDDPFAVGDSPVQSSAASLHRPPPPEPEPDLPFDFHRFLEQLRHRTADPVAKFLRSFLNEFGKKQWMVHEQVKIISDFLAFITNKMAQCEVWREVSDAEFDNAREGMEKLVMNRLYTQTFSPAIPPPQPIPGAKAKRRNGETPMGPGRRGQHQEDVERDEILAQKVGIYGWVKEEHLEIPPVGDSGKRFLLLAQQELLKIKTYRAPRDKIICVLNCCKVIFGLLKHSKSDSSADSFMPMLILVVLRANPEHLVSNVQYILRFRNQEKLAGEAGYYLSSLMGAVQFIENLDRTSLTITDEEFEKNVEAAVSAIAEKHQEQEQRLNPPLQVSEKAAPSKPQLTPRHSMEGESSVPRKSTSSNEDGDGDERAAIGGLLRTIQKPLSSIGRMFLDDTSGSQSSPAHTPLPGNTPRMSPAPGSNSEAPVLPPRTDSLDREANRRRFAAEDAAARQASAEAAEAHRIHRLEHNTVVETLAGMFPDLDRDIISDVVRQKEGRVGLAVDACLALSS